MRRMCSEPGACHFSNVGGYDFDLAIKGRRGTDPGKIWTLQQVLEIVLGS